MVFSDGDSRKGTDMASAPSTGHHGPGMARVCPLQAPAMELGAVGLLAAAGLGPVTIADALLQRLRPSPGAAWAVAFGVVLGAKPGVDQAVVTHLLNAASLS